MEKLVKKGEMVCPFEHPQKCHKFCSFGLKSKDEKGCDTTCGKYHPRLCRNSLFKKECLIKDCKYQHLNGTKTKRNANRKDNDSDKNTGGAKKEEKDSFLLIMEMVMDMQKRIEEQAKEQNLVNRSILERLTPKTSSHPLLHGIHRDY